MIDWFRRLLCGGRKRQHGQHEYPMTYDKTMGIPEAVKFAAAVRKRRYADAERIYNAATPELRSVLMQQLSIASVGDDEAVSAWYAAHPTNPVACIQSAHMMIELAWEKRSDQAAKDVSQGQWMGFHETLRSMQPLLAQVRDVAAADPQAWIVSIKHQLGLGKDLATATDYFERGCAIAPAHRDLHRTYMNYILPKWYGSIECMWGHARHLQETFPETHFESFVTTAWLEECVFLGMRGRADDARAVLDNPTMREAVIAAYLRTNLQSSKIDDVYALNLFACAFWRMKRHDLVYDALKRLKSRYCEGHWYYFSNAFPEGPRSLHSYFLELEAEHG